MNIHSAEFITSAVKPSQYPPVGLPEVAFAGRSNVGKSSLINTIVNRKRLVKTSRTPGRTQLINFFSINEKLMLVDLPGYGYAKVPAAIRKKWRPMIETYLAWRDSLRGVFLILDVRRTPDEREQLFVEWLTERRIPVVIVVTKIDKVKVGARTRRYRQIIESLPIDSYATLPILFSAKTKQGRKEVWKTIDLLTRPKT